MIQIFNADFKEWSTEAAYKNIDAVITDPEYDDTFWWYDKCRQVCSAGNILAFCNPENQWPNPDETLFWMKPLSTKNYTKRCGRFVEMIKVYRGNWTTFNVLHWSQMTGCYMDLLEEQNLHAWQKPLSLMIRLVKIYTNIGDTVLDPFMGSGSTGVACVLTGRDFIGLERDRDTFNIAKERLGV